MKHIKTILASLIITLFLIGDSQALCGYHALVKACKLKDNAVINFNTELPKWQKHLAEQKERTTYIHGGNIEDLIKHFDAFKPLKNQTSDETVLADNVSIIDDVSEFEYGFLIDDLKEYYANHRITKNIQAFRNGESQVIIANIGGHWIAFKLESRNNSSIKPGGNVINRIKYLFINGKLPE